MDHNRLYTECYGRNSLSEYNKARNVILSKYDENKLKILTENEIFDICRGNKRGVIRVSYLRALKILGVNCDKVDVEHNKYQTFHDKYSAMFEPSNMFKSYTNYYLPIIAKFGESSFLENKVSPLQFIEWYRNSRNVCKKSSIIHNILKMLGANENFLSSLKSIVYDDDRINNFLQEYRKDANNHHVESRMFAYYFKQLIELSNGEISSITADDAIKFCDVSTKHTTGYVKCKIDMLRFFGCKCLDKVIFSEQDKIRVCEAYKRCNFSNVMPHIKLHHFKSVDKCLGKIENALSDEIQTIVNKIEVLSNSGTAYSILKRYYEIHNPSMAIQLENISSYNMKKIRRADHFKLHSEWRRKLLDNIVECYRCKIYQTSAYPLEYIKDIEYKCCVILEHVEKYIRSIRETHGDAIRWFFFNCNGENVKNMLIDFGKSLDVDHTRVKNTYEDHHAKRWIVFALSVFKTETIKSLIQPTTYTEIEALGTQSILNHVENLRIIGESRRRVYLDEEVNAMLEITKDDYLYTLIITIFREIGLRAGAICNMRYGNIFDKHGTPRHVCKVLEKGNKVREFVTSPNLKKKMVSYINTLKKYEPIDQNVYIFNVSKNKPLPSTTLANKLKRIATEAGVTDIIVHPHAFRHTIVGKLMDVGNSAEVVSKFMGHSCVDTTLKWYWLKNIEDITKSINNPFINGKINPIEYRDEIEEELEQSRVKIETCLRIIHATYETIDSAVKNGDNVENLKSVLHSRMPTLQNTLYKIASSVGETNSMSNDIEDCQNDDN